MQIFINEGSINSHKHCVYFIKILLKMTRNSTYGKQTYKNLSHKKQPKVNLRDYDFLNF